MSFALACLSFLALGDAPAPRFETYVTTGADGARITGELGRISVPEDRSRPDGARVEIAFVRFRTASKEPLPPIVYLAGGPGGSGVELCVRPATGRLVNLLARHDVIGIDQRGTGLSRPNLADEGVFGAELPLDRAVTRAEFLAAHARAAQRMAEHWRARGVDLAAWHTDASADDVDDVRRALAIERWIPWSESYGTSLALAYARRHGEHVARAVLLRVEGPDDAWKLPGATQAGLARLGALVAADPGFGRELPDLPDAVRGLRDALAREPRTVTVPGPRGEENVVVGALDLELWTANALGLAFEMRDVPAAILAMRAGDWRVLGESAIAWRREPVGSAMALAIDCASGASAERLARIEAERADPANVLGDAANLPFPAVCAGLPAPRIGANARVAPRCAAPFLLVSGDLDARTPPANAEALRAHLPNSVHVLARNAGHESIEMLSDEFRSLLAAFLAGEPVRDAVIELPAPAFRR